MNAHTFADYRGEYTAEGVGSLLYSLIYDVVRQVAPHYPASVYAPNPQWDEDALRAMCHDFCIDKLLKSGLLEYHLLSQQTVDGLRRVLKRDLRHFLENRKRRSEYTNLFKRVRQILEEETGRFQQLQPQRRPSLALWGLADWEERAITERLDEVLTVMFAITLPPLKIYRADSEKLSHIINTDILVQLLETTFMNTNKWIRLDMLMDGLRYRLKLLDAGTVSLDDLMARTGQGASAVHDETAISYDNPEVVVTTAQLADDIFQCLSDRQRFVLAYRLADSEATLEVISRRVGASKSTVANELTAIAQLVRDMDLSEDEAERVLASLIELCDAFAHNTKAANSGVDDHEAASRQADDDVGTEG